MTCIAGIVQEGRVWIAADSLGTAGYSSVLRRDPKVFRLQAGPAEMVIAYTTSFRMGQVLQYKVTPPAYDPATGDPFRYLVTDFIDAVRAAFAAAGFQRVDSGVETGGCFLVGFQGRLFAVESDYQVGEPDLPYYAMGSGQELALGSLHATQQMVDAAPHLTPETRLHMAIAAAADHNASVGGRTHVLCLPNLPAEQCAEQCAENHLTEYPITDVLGPLIQICPQPVEYPVISPMVPEGSITTATTFDAWSSDEVVVTTEDLAAMQAEGLLYYTDTKDSTDTAGFQVTVVPPSDEPTVENISLSDRRAWQPTSWEPDGLPEQAERVGESLDDPQNPNSPIYVCPDCGEIGINNCTCDPKAGDQPS